MSEFQEVRDRLITLETQSKERWIAHDVQSKLIWKTIDEKLNLLLKHKDSQETRKEDCMKETKQYTKTMIGWVLGIPVTIGTVIGLAVGIKRLFFS